MQAPPAEAAGCSTSCTAGSVSGCLSSFLSHPASATSATTPTTAAERERTDDPPRSYSGHTVLCVAGRAKGRVRRQSGTASYLTFGVKCRKDGGVPGAHDDALVDQIARLLDVRLLDP